MSQEKYIKLKHFQELMKLIYTRDGYHDWSNEYEKYDNEIKHTVKWLERNAKELSL